MWMFGNIYLIAAISVIGMFATPQTPADTMLEAIAS